MQGYLPVLYSLLYWTHTANLKRQLLCWMFPMVTTRLIVRAQMEMADRCILRFKEASRPPAMENTFLREVQVSHKQDDGHTQMNTQTIVHSGFVVSHSESLFLFEEPNFYQYRFGLLWENSSWPWSHSSLWASEGPVNRLHKFPCLYSLWLSPATNNPYLSWDMLVKIPAFAVFTLSQLYFPKYKTHSLIRHLRGILKLLLSKYLQWGKKQTFSRKAFFSIVQLIFLVPVQNTVASGTVWSSDV